MPKSRSTPARRRPAHSPQEEAVYVYNLMALLDRLDRDDLLDETAPACPLFCQAHAQAFLDEATEEAPLRSFNLSNVGPSLASQKRK